ncbi:DUF6151 family protein [Microbulbifer rhizosphaerae]|uniref:CENP-V/GFA domain-containing protein n=1 Tax=Microbulbifer rhizosphaerae TaxID=1562603 RepID=A0A7W4ZAT1_9GAMM|nr:DUF6151 family protein [Microbulbifer rhizosphaerae]MBB3063117.1 hypothetical protein [Microbulbifer rhizosphaerae]
MVNIKLKCSCSAVEGKVVGISPNTGTRLVCYCDDCQAFARYLGREKEIADQNGGTDIFQLPPSRIEISKGKEQLRCMRLTPKGMNRWYTDCCKTPIGNTVSGGMPFVGMIHNFMDNAKSRDTDLGPVLGHVQTKFAKGILPRAQSFGSSAGYHLAFPAQNTYSQIARSGPALSVF